MSKSLLCRVFKNFFYPVISSTRLQILLSVILSSFLLVLSFFLNKPFIIQNLTEHTQFITFMSAIAASLALIGSISFGFQLHYLQSVSTEESTLYARYSSLVADFENSTEIVAQNKELYAKCIELTNYLKGLQRKHFPLEKDVWNSVLENIDSVVGGSHTYSGNPEQKRMEFLLKLIIENLGEFGIIEVKRILSTIFLDVVIKCFITSSSIIFIITMSNIYYSNVAKVFFFYSSLFSGIFTALLILEVSLKLYFEIKRVYLE